MHGKIKPVATHKLASVNAFVIFDLEDAETSSGLVRCAPKILPSSAAELARSATYTFAAHSRKRSGASAGINAKGDERDEAVRAFTGEIAEMVATGRFLPDAGRGVTEDDLLLLRAGDLRGDALFMEYEGMPLATYLRGIGAVAAVGAALSGLEGRTAALEGFDLTGLAAAKELDEQGAKVVAVSTGAGVALASAGFSHAELSEAFAAHGEEMVKNLRDGGSGGSTEESIYKAGPVDANSENAVSDDAGNAASIWSAEADVFFAGSKIGAVDHNVAELFAPSALASLTPLAFTTKALVNLQRKGTKVLPDFVCLGGPLYAEAGSGKVNQGSSQGADAGEGKTGQPSGGNTAAPSANDAIAATRSNMAALVDEASQHPEGIFLGACAVAEQFLLTWRDEAPFGRPLAP